MHQIRPPSTAAYGSRAQGAPPASARDQPGHQRKHVDGDDSALERGENTRQLDISYRDPSDTRPLVSGDRAPDAPIIDTEGNKVRLYELFRGPHETLLRFSPSTPATHPHTVDISSPEAFAIYHARPGDEILVRPDGYLA